MAKQKLKHSPHSKFKAYLIENRIKQKTVAAMLNISPVTLNQKINGYLNFSFDEVEKICIEYNLDANIFLTHELRKSNKIERGIC